MKIVKTLIGIMACGVVAIGATGITTYGIDGPTDFYSEEERKPIETEIDRNTKIRSIVLEIISYPLDTTKWNEEQTANYINTWGKIIGNFSTCVDNRQAWNQYCYLIKEIEGATAEEPSEIQKELKENGKWDDTYDAYWEKLGSLYPPVKGFYSAAANETTVSSSIETTETITASIETTSMETSETTTETTTETSTETSETTTSILTAAAIEETTDSTIETTTEETTTIEETTIKETTNTTETTIPTTILTEVTTSTNSEIPQTGDKSGIIAAIIGLIVSCVTFIVCFVKRKD